MPGNVPPVSLLTGSGVRADTEFFGFSTTTKRKPSSIREVSVRRSAVALRLARASKSRGSLMVVRTNMPHEISPLGKHLKWPRGTTERFGFAQKKTGP